MHIFQINELETENLELKNKVQDLENQLRITEVHTLPVSTLSKNVSLSNLCFYFQFLFYFHHKPALNYENYYPWMHG